MQDTDTKPHARPPVECVRSVLRVVFSGARPLIPSPIVRVPAKGSPIGRDVAHGVRLDDSRLSRHHATVHSAEGGLSLVDHASKNGCFVNGSRVDRCELAHGDVVSVGDTCLVVAEEPPEEDAPVLESLSGDSAAMRRARARVRTLAPTNLTVLLVAETGSGKEVTARALHDTSGLKGPFMAVNCAAIPENLFESQLFGHVAGAFTGASAHVGFFRAAAGGTLFLDEIGELPATLQPKLLRVLEERAVVPLGSTRPIPCHVRIIAATNRDLSREVERGAFRADLLARLFEATIPLPPLRERREDILSLFVHVLGGKAPPMTHAFAEALLLHSWPYNVRELAATAREVTSASSAAASLDLPSLRQRLGRFSARSAPHADRTPALRGEGAALTADELRALLTDKGGTVSDVARAVGRSRRQVYRWIEKYGIRVEDFRR